MRILGLLFSLLVICNFSFSSFVDHCDQGESGKAKVSCHSEQSDQKETSTDQAEHKGNCFAHCAHHVAFLATEVVLPTVVFNEPFLASYRFSHSSIILEGPLRPPSA